MDNSIHQPFFEILTIESCKKVCVFDSTSAFGLYNISKPNVALSSFRLSAQVISSSDKISSDLPVKFRRI